MVVQDSCDKDDRAGPLERQPAGGEPAWWSPEFLSVGLHRWMEYTYNQGLPQGLGGGPDDGEGDDGSGAQLPTQIDTMTGSTRTVMSWVTKTAYW